MSLAINLTAVTSIALMIMTTGVIVQSFKRFTFQDAEFLLDEQEGFQAAKSFVTTELTPGLPMREAIMRVEQARAACGAPAISAALERGGFRPTAILIGKATAPVNLG